MVNICQNRFKNNERVIHIAACDISREALPFRTTFDFISSIRVLKYNKNWKDIVRNCIAQLNPGGIFLFTMPNKYSINFFSSYHIPYSMTKKSELVTVAEKNDSTILAIKSFTRIPDFFYELTNNFIYVKLLKLLERFLETLLGKTLFGRILFIVVKKK
jgi:SAM-dependent methyltransferase